MTSERCSSNLRIMSALAPSGRYTVHLSPSVRAAQAAASPAFPPDAMMSRTSSPRVALTFCANSDMPLDLKDCAGWRFLHCAAYQLQSWLTSDWEMTVTSSFRYASQPRRIESRLERISGVSCQSFAPASAFIARQTHAIRTQEPRF